MQLFEPIFRALESGQVRYVAVGGIATVLHGVIRLTRDVDLVVDLDPIQARRVVEVLLTWGSRRVSPCRRKHSPTPPSELPGFETGR